MKQPKFKIGDEVKCISRDDLEHLGCGWELNKIFIVGSITFVIDRYLYWPENGDGVYENGLILAQNLELENLDNIQLEKKEGKK